VNSIRVRLETVLEWMAKAGPDVSVYRSQVAQLSLPTSAFAQLGYRVAVSGEKTYNGVAVLSRHDLTSILAGFPDYAAAGQSAHRRHRGRSQDSKRLHPQRFQPDSPKCLNRVRSRADVLSAPHA